MAITFKRKSVDLIGKRANRLVGVKSKVLDPELVKSMVADGTLRQVNDPTRVMRFIASTTAVDRMGDIIVQNWDFTSFDRNPVILWNHDQNIPIGRSVGQQVIEDENDEHFKNVGPYLAIYVEFANAEHGDHVDPIYKMYRDGFLTGGSVGFVPLEVDECRDELKRKEYGLGPEGVIYTKSELAEFTLCTVPANRDVVVTGMKSLSAKERIAVRNLLMPIERKPVVRTPRTEQVVRTPAKNVLRTKMSKIRDGFIVLGRSDDKTMAFGVWREALQGVTTQFDAILRVLGEVKTKVADSPKGAVAADYSEAVEAAEMEVQRAKTVLKKVEGGVKDPASIVPEDLAAMETELKSVYDIGVNLAGTPLAESIDLEGLGTALDAHNAAYGSLLKTLAEAEATAPAEKSFRRRAREGEEPAEGTPPKTSKGPDAHAEVEILEALLEELLTNYDVPEAVAEDVLDALEALELKLGFEEAESEEEAEGKAPKPAPKVPAPKADARAFRAKPRARHYASILERANRPGSTA